MSNFDYLNIMAPSPVQQSTYKGNQNNRFKKITDNTNIKGELGHFKSKLMDLLSREFERPLDRELELIKRKRGETEYKDDIRKVRMRLANMRESAEDTLLDMRRYLDYVEVQKNTEGNSRLYLPGLEEKKRLDKIKLPDLLGFTKDPVKGEYYLPFLMEMARTFLGFEGYSLHSALAKLKAEVPRKQVELVGSEQVNMDFCKEFTQLDYKPLYEIENYYNLMRMLEDGEFDINKFLGSSEKKGNRFNRDDDRDYKKKDKKKKKKGRRDFFGGDPRKDRLSKLFGALSKNKGNRGKLDLGKIKIDRGR